MKLWVKDMFFLLSLKQLIRTPFRTLLFTILLALVGVFLCLCCALWFSTHKSIENAEKTFTTIAVPNLSIIRRLTGIRSIPGESQHLFF